MSFSSDVKLELAERIPNGVHCCVAELSGLALYLATVQKHPDGELCLNFFSENPVIAKKCFTFLKKSFNMAIVASNRVNIERKRMEYGVKLEKTSNVKKVLSTLGFSLSEDSRKLNLTNTGFLKKPCCKRAWIRGLFLCAGSMNDPAKSYHFEITVPDETTAGFLAESIQEFADRPKVMTRKQQTVVYIKDGTVIADLLKLMEAPVSLINYENERVVREFRGTINRRVNCEVSNLSKTTTAARRQIENIELIRDTMGLDDLPEVLKELAILRLENTESSLQELGELLHPPMGRSGVNHRLQRINDIADRLRSR